MSIILQPEAAPGWMSPLLTDLRGEHIRSHLGIGPADESIPGSAVLIALAGQADSEDLPADARVLLTHRNPQMRSHPGQVAFPGGHIEVRDADPVAAALREAREETGLRAEHVTPLVQFSPAHVRTRKRPVYPVLGHWHHPLPLQPESAIEVADVFSASIAELVDPANRLTVGFASYSGPAFLNNGYLVWGFTAGILSALVEAGGWAQPWDSEPVHDLFQVLKASRNHENRG